MSAYLSLIGRRRGGRLFEVGANSRLGAYSNKYGNQRLIRSLDEFSTVIGFCIKLILQVHCY